jgi:hypothetical protein
MDQLRQRGSFEPAGQPRRCVSAEQPDQGDVLAEARAEGSKGF